MKTARKDIEYNLKHIVPYVQKGYKVICSEPSAALCLKDEMRLINNSQDARLVSGNTFELMDYLRGHVEKNPDSLSLNNEYAGKKIAYHAPCHLKSLRLAGVSIELLNKCGMDVSDINGGCCGLAGTAGMQKKHHDLSDAIGSLLTEKIAETNPDIILTECAACKMQIEHLTGKLVVHPIKLLSQAF
ncbi:MAG: heterodisulfide reductase-related iron-sulfur binding cluster [Planctomycetota bacterium]